MSQHLYYHKDSVLSSHYGKKNFYCYYYNVFVKGAQSIYSVQIANRECNYFKKIFQKVLGMR